MYLKDHILIPPEAFVGIFPVKNSVILSLPVFIQRIVFVVATSTESKSEYNVSALALVSSLIPRLQCGECFFILFTLACGSLFEYICVYNVSEMGRQVDARLYK